MLTVPDPLGAMVMLWPDPAVVTVIVAYPPVAVSVAVQVVPAGMPVYSWETVPAAVPAGMTKGASAVAPHVSAMVTSPC